MAGTSCTAAVFLEFQDVALSLATLVEESIKETCQQVLVESY